MTIQERAILLREAFPDASWSDLGRVLRCSRQTVQCYVDPEYKKQRRKSGKENLVRRIAEAKTKLVQLFGSKCEQCGYGQCIDALDFHHKDESRKIADVSDLLTGKFENALEEAKKCVLLCANCHRAHHAVNKIAGSTPTFPVSGGWVGEPKAEAGNPASAF